nr:THxN family PEP-CTERM protein [uncultured Glaciecola sp.]
MNNLRSKFKILACSSILASSLAVSSFAQAGLVSISDLNASWLNINPNSISAIGNGTNSAFMYWGNDTGSGQSGYNFTTAAVPININLPPSPSAAFDLGSWTHFNNPITGTTLNSATLELAADIWVDTVWVGVKKFLFTFNHNETPNGGVCEATGAGVNVNGCADIVTVDYSLISDTFMVGSDEYTLNIFGGSSYFETKEAADNAFNIQGELTLRSNLVPEPSGLMIMGIGLGLLGFMGTKHRRKL